MSDVERKGWPGNHDDDVMSHLLNSTVWITILTHKQMGFEPSAGAVKKFTLKTGPEWKEEEKKHIENTKKLLWQLINVMQKRTQESRSFGRQSQANKYIQHFNWHNYSSVLLKRVSFKHSRNGNETSSRSHPLKLG